MNKSDVTNYLAKEVETLTKAIMDFRAKIAFTFWVGPFIVLGSVILSAQQKSGRLFNMDFNPEMEWAIGIVAIAYLALGFIGGNIERQAWQKCDEWRRCIIELQHEEAISDEVLLRFILHESIVKKIHWAYLLVFFLMLLIFSAIAYLALKLVT